MVYGAALGTMIDFEPSIDFEIDRVKLLKQDQKNHILHLQDLNESARQTSVKTSAMYSKIIESIHSMKLKIEEAAKLLSKDEHSQSDLSKIANFHKEANKIFRTTVLIIVDAQEKASSRSEIHTHLNSKLFFNALRISILFGIIAIGYFLYRKI
jgi:hypothetical protein